MGFRFRRSIKIAPGIRLNLNAKSTSVRIGPRGLGYTFSSTGKQHVSAGIPGTGISVTETLKPARKPARSYPELTAQSLALIDTEKKTPSGLSIVIGIVAILFGIGWCSNRVSKPESSLLLESRQSENVETAPVESTAAAPNVSIAPQTVDPTIQAVGLYTTAGVRLRAEPTVNSDIILTVPDGALVKSFLTKGQWHNVTYGARIGWIRGDYLAKQKSVQRDTPPAQPLPLLTTPVRPHAKQPARTLSSRGYIRGPRGGCYYLTGSGKKQYVDRGLCH